MSFHENPKFLLYAVYATMFVLFAFPMMTLSIDRNKNVQTTAISGFNILLALVVLVMFIKQVPILKTILFVLVCLLLACGYNIYTTTKMLKQTTDDKTKQELQSIISVNSIGAVASIVCLGLFLTRYYKMVQSTRSLKRMSTYRPPHKRTSSAFTPKSVGDFQ